MSFAGLRSDEDRINLIAFLRTQRDSPGAIPAPKPAAAPAAAARHRPMRAAPADAAAKPGAAPADAAEEPAAPARARPAENVSCA